MSIDRVRVDRYLAYLGFTLSFLFLLAIVALAVTTANGNSGTSLSSITATPAAKK